MPDGPSMREKPTLLLLHGGPGFDHSIYKPVYSSLADCAQIVYLDHRGNGRSDAGPKDAGRSHNGATTCAPSATCLALSVQSSWELRLAARSQWPMQRVTRRIQPS